jgi:hypothetical protein
VQLTRQEQKQKTKSRRINKTVQSRCAFKIPTIPQKITRAADAAVAHLHRWPISTSLQSEGQTQLPLHCSGQSGRRWRQPTSFTLKTQKIDQRTLSRSNTTCPTTSSAPTANMNLHLSRHIDAAAPGTATCSDLSDGSCPVPSRWPRATVGRSVHDERPAASVTLPHIPVLTANQPPSRSPGRRSRPRITKNHNHQHHNPRRTCRNSSSNHTSTYTASPFSRHHLSPDHQQQARPRPPHTFFSRVKSLFFMLRRQIHLLKFNLLLRFGHLRTWLSAKLRPQKPARCLRTHNIIRSTKPEEPRRPFFSRGPSNYETSQRGQRAAAATMTARKGGSNDGDYGGDEKQKTGRMRRISQSTVKSLKKACSLNSERSDLMQEDRRAMERLDELWRSREVHHV